MTRDRFIEVFKQVRPGTKLRIEGYISQDGSIGNYTVEVLKPEGYMDLVRQSREQLLARRHTFNSTNEKAACSKLLDAWGKTLARTSTRNYVEKLRPAINMPVLLLSDVQPDVYVLCGLRNLIPPAKVLPPDEKTNQRSTRERDPINVICDEIKDTLPIASFIGRLNLVPETLDDVTILP